MERGAITLHSPIGDLAICVLRAQFRALRDHEAGTRDGSDPEELHDMRVATRRLRAALRCFEDVLPESAADLRQEVGWLGRSLSAVRDLDVQMENLDALRGALPVPDQSGVAEIHQILEANREQAQRILIQELDSERYKALLESIETFLGGEVGYQLDVTVASEAPRLVQRMFRKLRRLGDTLDNTSPSEDLHALRIRAKRVRYATEFVAGLYGDPAQKFIKKVVKLQDVLGDQHDAEVAVAQLRSLVMERDGLGTGSAFAMGEMAQRHVQHGDQLRGRFERVYKRAVGKAWRRLRRALAEPPVAPDDSARG